MKNILNNYKYNEKMPLNGFKDIARKAASEGIVLLKNDNNILPLKENSTISIFGRIQFDYYKSGTGSGGLVNINKVTSILDGLEENPKINVNRDLVNHYLKWLESNPFNAGNGMWASEPWNQKEMKLDDDIVKEARNKSDIALIIIGRTAGEDRDNWLHEGSYLLSKDEEEMIEKVTNYFNDVIVVLNVGNIIDLSFLDKFHVKGLVIAWQGGMEGGRATSDVLCGDVNPSGKLSDSIPYSIEDVPSNKYFGDKSKNFYVEDIYIGYRYYETFKVKVRYPFGFGLSYTTFDIYNSNIEYKNSKLYIKTKVKNVGKKDGKEVVQIYIECPNNKLYKPTKSLIGFNKTKLLAPNEEEELEFIIDDYLFSSYDDNNATGHKSCYVLEKGIYNVYIGNSIKNLELINSFNIENIKIIKKLNEAMSPTEPFKRLICFKDNEKIYEDVSLRTYNLHKRIKDNIPIEEYPSSTNKVKLIDVYNDKYTINEFINQLSNEELASLFRGEGMSSPKVTPGCGAAFGGVTPNLKEYGFPIACLTDGPSGIRMDSGYLATSIPNGTLLACTFNLELVEYIGILLGLEMKNYNIDTLLGPGLNIHRHPFNGRNFEYFSEDPLLTGMMAGAYVRGIQKTGRTCTLKHLACNSQETSRFDSNSIVSERALREIYLKGYEIAIKYSDARIIMTSYNPINGIWSASNYDLNTEIVRNEWGFKGIIITDWWAKMNDDNDEGSKQNTQFMIRAQNDAYMVVSDSLSNSNNDLTIESLNIGIITRNEMLRNAKNITKYLMNTPAFSKENNVKIALGLSFREYMKTNKKGINIPFINNIYIDDELLDDFTPIISTYYINKNINETTNIILDIDENYSYKIYKKNKVISIIISNNEDNFIYNIMTIDENRNYGKSTFKFKDIEHKHTTDIPNVNNELVNIKLENYSYKSNNINFNGKYFDNLPKDSFLCYSININEYGKYIIQFEVTTEDIGLAQIPFTTFVGSRNKNCLTVGNFNGKDYYISEQIVMHKGTHLLSFNFKMTGLIIKKINIIKHP